MFDTVLTCPLRAARLVTRRSLADYPPPTATSRCARRDMLRSDEPLSIIVMPLFAVKDPSARANEAFCRVRLLRLTPPDSFSGHLADHCRLTPSAGS